MTDGPVIHTPVIHTLGHSRHSIRHFADLARRHGIDTVIDVRGQPRSRFNPQFNREAFRDALQAHGLAYRWEGERLSGRPNDRRFYRPDGKLDLAALREWPALAEGLGDVRALAQTSRVALVCAEEDPLRCHRRFLLTPPLIAAGWKIVHIRGDGRTEDETEVAARARGGTPDQPDLFAGGQDVHREARGEPARQIRPPR